MKPGSWARGELAATSTMLLEPSLGAASLAVSDGLLSAEPHPASTGLDWWACVDGPCHCLRTLLGDPSGHSR